MFNRWWRIVSCINLHLTLGKKNINVYNEIIHFLNEFTELVKKLRVGSQGKWKSFQSGLIIPTKSLIELNKELFNENYVFVIPGRFSQGCLENLFSSLRVKNVVMNALQLKNNLKLITVALFLKTPSKSSYHDDDRNYLWDFISELKTLKVKKKEQDILK